ncbi:four-carbon acid sugar kinase family protein [Methylobacterium nodulans]|uniref:Type III effector Hrp-dependent outers n=1 Tax=Methylobacterium nodulans (strain LMG 21967 / CNCM I-2342 / ORS 2060) TaxID=460265 RepID=B8IMG4_METNO|nr:four-carbon acid sugar kinase family protein [Methylobacterium nodulans]ACL58350.1 type III effector Hrp-dependent outers [Methylobacterium nodulans ORS 2060]
MTAPRPLRDGPLVGFYGDDLTGSSAAMEVLAFAGLETVLFLQPPSPERLGAFASARAVGIAGMARSQPPDWMDRHLPPVFRLLAALGAPVCHYNVCSTFDSAPHVGSIGRAAEIGAAVLNPTWIPMVVADPGMGRYQSFGNLFAMAGEIGHRLDRHPTMARHPITPMNEADLRRHLARQTALPIGLVDFVAMKRGEAEARLAREREAGARIVSLDMLDRETLVEAGRLIWERGGAPVFGIGSQGFEAALVAYWRAAGLLPAAPTPARPPAVARIACVSGSVSPGTAAQIAFALDHGFAGIRLDATRAVDAAEWERETGRAAEQALAELGQGRDPLVFTAFGPDDPAVAALRRAVRNAGETPEAVNDRIGAGLGAILHRVVREARLTRAVIAGGDTSGRAAAMLGIDALTALAPMAPGSPLCRAHGADGAPEGLEVALKGGQVGRPDFFQAVKRGA